MAFLDYASGAPLHPAARAVLVAAYDEGWAEPGKLYGAGRRARLLLDDARARIASALGARPGEVSFAASGADSIRLGLNGLLSARRRVGTHLVTTAVEHSSLLAVASAHERAGGEVTRVDVSPHGAVAAPDIAAAIRPDTAVVSVQHANHEVGTVQPIADVAAVCAERGIPLHVDAAQSVGRIPIDVGALGVNALSASARKWGGPPGAGVLVVRRGTRWRRTDGADEAVNVPAVVAAAAALDARLTEMDAEAARLSALVDRIRREVPRLIADVDVVGDPVARLPHIVTFSFLYVDGEALLTELDKADIAVSSGSACASEEFRPSHVLAAMGVLTHGNVRVSLGRDTTE
ncbi:MAG: cysteine desulfurase, partial [Frankia sp.]|nr:cysteine desulfurase [Frankia sp.]